MQDKEIQLLDWGASMYGGYFANFFYDGEYTGEHGRTLKELREIAKGYDITYRVGMTKADLVTAIQEAEGIEPVNAVLCENPANRTAIDPTLAGTPVPK